MQLYKKAASAEAGHKESWAVSSCSKNLKVEPIWAFLRRLAFHPLKVGIDSSLRQRFL